MGVDSCVPWEEAASFPESGPRTTSGEETDNVHSL